MEERNYLRCLESVTSNAIRETFLKTWGNEQVIDRSFLPNFVFGLKDTVIAIGQDGLVANTLKYLQDGQPLISPPVTIRSLMPENGVIFSDGIEKNLIEFNSGASVTVSLADVSGNLVVC
jgi:hypothetical protein